MERVQRRRLNERPQLPRESQQAIAIGNYMRNLNELYINGGIYYGAHLEVPNEQLRNYTYFSLASMTPNQIRELYSPEKARMLYFIINVPSSNFTRANQFDYYETVDYLLTFTNERGILTSEETEHGRQLSQAYNDLFQRVMNEYEPEIIATAENNDFDDGWEEMPDNNEELPSERHLVRQQRDTQNVGDDAWEVHNYAKNINKKDLINFLQDFVNSHPEAEEFRIQGLTKTSDKDAFLNYLKNTLLEFINKYVDDVDKRKYREGLDKIMNECLGDIDFTRISYDNMKLSDFLVLVLSFVQSQQNTFIDSYVRGIIKETTGSYIRGDAMSCPKGAWERMWTILGDLAQTFEGQSIYSENKYMQLYSIINNLYHIDYKELLNQFTNDWYKQLQLSTDSPESNNRETNIAYYKNYVVMRFNNHMNQLFQNPSEEEIIKINEHKDGFNTALNNHIANPPDELDEAFDYVYKSTSIGGRKYYKKVNKKVNKNASITKKHNKKYNKNASITKKHNKKYNKRKNVTKKHNKKGGFLNTIGFEMNGVGFSKQTGQKQYNWKTGKWDDLDCYKIGNLPQFCKIKPAK